jgi:hypothetical protein
VSGDSPVAGTATDAPVSASDTKPARKRAAGTRVPNDLNGIARAMLRANGVKSDDRLSEQKKVLRGQLRGKYWGALVKSAPKLYGPRGTVKREPNDRRPWGTIPADVARAIIKNAKR